MKSELLHKYITARDNALKIIDKCTEAYDKKVAKELISEMEIIGNTIKKRYPRFDLRYRQYNIMMSKRAGLLGALLYKWSCEGAQNPIFVGYMKDQISRAFQDILDSVVGK